MRPLSLTVEGFTCFSERQPPLDFGNLHLFAITGPTGAGKSSILDAMTFALYGYVPRLGKAGADLITSGRDRLAVEFAFAVGERTFRVARTLRRKQSAKVVLDETTAGKVRPLDGASVKIADFDPITPVAADGQTLSAEVMRILENTIREAAAAPTLNDALEIGYAAFGVSACTAAVREGISAFQERRARDFAKTG